jgi:hypothetical protein
MKFMKLVLAASIASLVNHPLLAAEKTAEMGASRYLQCDGQPNNTTAGESAARLLGAVTLLGIFAPAPEFPDPAARRFGTEGVKICSALIDGTENVEGNPVRRLELILARAIHQIEAKNYEAAIADVRLARGEAEAKGFARDIYFDRSMGLSFNLIEAEALVRLRRFEEARELSLSRVTTYPNSYYPIIAARSYATHIRNISETERKRLTVGPVLIVGELYTTANRLEEAGEFAEAARLREAWIKFVELLNNEDRVSSFYAVAAITHALNGDFQKADERAAFARKNVEELARLGRPDSTKAATLEMLDFYELIKDAHAGKMQDARRSYSARSGWENVWFGAQMEVNRRLRNDAKPDELRGLLSKSPEEMWRERSDLDMAALLERDKNNKTLFSLILPLAKAESYESLSKAVWRTEKSRIMGKEPDKKSKEWPLAINSDPTTQPDAMLLHAALQATARGSVRFEVGDGEKIVEDLQMDADAVIAELGQIIPPPAEAAARKAERAKKLK